MDVLALIAYLVALVIFAVAGFANRASHPLVNVSSGLFFLVLGILLSAFAVTGSNVG